MKKATYVFAGRDNLPEGLEINGSQSTELFYL